MAQLLPKSSGWRLVREVRASRTKLKPGLEAEAPGAAVRIQLLPATQRANPFAPPGTPPEAPLNLGPDADPFGSVLGPALHQRELPPLL